MAQKKTGLVILIVISALAVVFAVVALLQPKNEAPRSASTNGFNIDLPGFKFSTKKTSGKKFFKSEGYIAKIYIDGIIAAETNSYNQKWILDTIADLKDDAKNEGIILYLNTPGGGVYQSDELYLALLDYKATTERPVYAYITQMAASGGYYIACAADKIYGNRNGLTGSIGVIFGQSVDATELLKKIGIKTRTFHTGKNKTMLSYDEPLTEEQAHIMQSIADDAYNQFITIVSEGRNMPIGKVRVLADGRIYNMSQAKEAGLVDGICSFDDALKTMLEDAELAPDTEAVEYTYEYNDRFSSFFGNMLSRITGSTALTRQLEKTNLSYPAYYFNW
ncbi:MAG: signal peptide peptidase SppA [Treponema sp.]|nr:signal peptide peptidase SppA [Treponema sp.]